MIFHAQNMACHLLSQLNFVGREECEAIGLILELVLTHNVETGSSDISRSNLHFAQRFLPQLTELAARYDPVYRSEKPLHMVNIQHMLSTIVHPLVADWSSYERSEFHSTMHAAQQFLHSDLANVKSVVSKWAHAHPNGVADCPRRHIGAWERSTLAHRVARPTAQIVVPPRSAPSRPPISSILLTHKRTASSISRPTSSTPQAVKLAELAQALEVNVDLGSPRFSSASGSSGSTHADSPVVSTPKDNWRAQWDYFEEALMKNPRDPNDPSMF